MICATKMPLSLPLPRRNIICTHEDHHHLFVFSWIDDRSLSRPLGPLIPLTLLLVPLKPAGFKLTQGNVKLYVLFSLEKSNIPEPSSDLPLTEFTLKGFVMLPHVRVVLALFSKLQVADVALPDPEVQILIRPSVNISPVGILLEAVHLYEVHPQSAQPLVHVVVLWAVLAILAKAHNLRGKLEIHAF